MIVLSLLLMWGEIRVMGRVKMRKPFKICLLTKPGPEMCGSRVLGSVEMGAGQAVGRLVPCPHPHHQEMREINLEIEMIFFFPEWISPIFVYITSEQLIPTLYSIWKGSWPILRDFQVDFFFFPVLLCSPLVGTALAVIASPQPRFSCSHCLAAIWEAGLQHNRL